MDIQRPDISRKRRTRRIIYGGSALVAVALLTWGFGKLKPAAPSVDRSTVWVDTVKRGPMLRQVRGLGTLVPEEIRWIPAQTDGRVERIVIRPGAIVKPDSVILELSNDELQQSTMDATWQRKASEAELTNVRARLQSDLLTTRANAATVQSDYNQAKLQVQTNEELFKFGLTSELILKLSQVRAQELGGRNLIEQERVATFKNAAEAQIAVQQARVEQLRALEQLKHTQIEALRVRAGVAGVLQLVPVEVGQRFTPGTNLARVADPSRLKAQVRIAETQAKDIQIGQLASVDTRNGVVEGKVARIDPSVVNGTVTVDVVFEGPLPQGARPDLTVDGTIEIERLAEVIYLGRPAFGQERSTVGLFLLTDGGQGARRVQVKLGRSSVNTIEILEGLQPGDQVILSDMSAQDNYDRIRLR
jgi:HlyD family secretion protein